VAHLQWNKQAGTGLGLYKVKVFIIPQKRDRYVIIFQAFHKEFPAQQNIYIAEHPGSCNRNGKFYNNYALGQG
jgi:type IV secretory pathway protease TraF